jgi:hypothetical protein
MAIIIEEITLYMVKIHPKNPKVARIESTPVIGVEIKKLCTAPLLAPSFLREFARGITLHEQRGNGTPKSVAFMTDRYELSPKCLETKSSGIICFKIPATTRPTNINIAIAFDKCIKFIKN